MHKCNVGTSSPVLSLVYTLNCQYLTSDGSSLYIPLLFLIVHLYSLIIRCCPLFLYDFSPNLDDIFQRGRALFHILYPFCCQISCYDNHNHNKNRNYLSL